VDYFGRIPKAWNDHGAFLPLDECEAKWLSFNAAAWKPAAVKVGVAVLTPSPKKFGITRCVTNRRINSYVGPNCGWMGSTQERISSDSSSPWAWGKDTVESQVTDGPDTGEIRVKAFDPKPRIFPDQPPLNLNVRRDVLACALHRRV